MAIRRTLTSAAFLLVLLLPCLSLAADDPQEIPYRRGELTIDGDLGDWTGPSLLVELEDPLFPPPAGNRAVIRVTWDHDTLWFAFDVFDAELLLPPEGISGLTLYQWDSVEIYLDSDGNATPRMDSRDFQFILSAGGDYVVQQGDPMLYEIHDWQVPKRER
ncbi:MAG: sugar-binding protein, partial [bacterium]